MFTGMIIRRTFKFRLYPNKQQVNALESNLSTCRWLYNCALQERRDAYENWKRFNHRGLEKPKVNKYSQSQAFTEMKSEIPELQSVYDHVLRDVLNRLEKSFDNFYRRVKQGETPGYPRFQGKARFDSFLYPDKQDVPDSGKGPGWSILNNKLTLSKVGGVDKLKIKIKLHRKMTGLVRTLAIKREAGGWYACFSVAYDKEVVPIEVPSNPVGIDMGLAKFLTQSNGYSLDNPRHLRASEEKLKTVQRAISSKKRRSNNRGKAVKQFARLHRRVANQRKDFLHRSSYKLVKRFDAFFFEDLIIANMSKRPKPKQDEDTGQFLPNNASAKAGLNKSIMDAGWGMFYQFTNYKAEEAGKTCEQVDPRYTSMICSGCGVLAEEKAPLGGDRLFRCKDCGTVLDRDVNAAANILKRGLFKAAVPEKGARSDKPVKAGKSQARSPGRSTNRDKPAVGCQPQAPRSSKPAEPKQLSFEGLLGAALLAT